MEVLGSKFKEIRSAVSSSVSSTVFSTISTVKDVLPGNPVTRDFEVNEHVASGGPGLLWKIYSGSKKSTRQPAAIFVLEKRQLDQKFPDKHEREALLDQFRKAIAQLTRLRHPQILTVQHPLEESRDSLAFATEPVYASLANVIGRHENLPSPVPSHLRDYKLFDVEIKYGMLQLCEGLTFLHESVKMLHRGISPDNIILNHQGAWKIFGFDFSLPNSAPQGVAPAWEYPIANEAHLNDCCRPDLDFMAPEYGLDRDTGYKLTSGADMFSLGMVAFTLYNTKPLFTNCGSWSSFKKNAGELKTLRESNLQLIPAELKSSLKLMLNVSPEIRPTASQLAQISFFEDVGVKTLNNLDSQFQWDNLQKSQFYKGLPHVLPRLPHRVALNRVVPCLAKEFVNHQMVPFVLPSVLYIAEEASKADYVTHILPDLKQVMKITDPVQILLIFMQKMEMLLSKTPPADVKSDVLPMIYRALEADTAQIQELCLSIIPGFAGLLEFQATKQALLPRIKKLCINTNLLSVRVNCLVCIGKLLQHLDKWLVLDDVFPMLQQIPSREPAVIMGIIGIYKLTLSDNKLGMTKEVIATKVLPFLFPLSIENGLTVSQYGAIMGLIRELISKVEEEHREKLQQLSSLQSEQKSALQVSMSESLKPDQLISAPKKQSEMDSMFSGLGLGDYVSQKDTGAVATGLMQTEKSSVAPISSMTSPAPSTLTSSSNLTLQQKEKIFQDAERNREWSSKSAITPMSSNTTRPTSGAKDLTASLMNANLNQMKTSQTFSSLGSMGTAASPNYNWGSMGASNNFPSASPAMGAQQPKPDLSSFDSILPMKPKANQPMNSMRPQNPTQMMTMPPQPIARPSFPVTNQFGGTPGIMQPTSMNSNMNGTNGQKPPVKSLTASDISDFLN